MLPFSSLPSAAGGRSVDSTSAEVGWACGNKLPSERRQSVPNLTDYHSQFQ